MPNGASFERFFEGWLVRQEHYLDELLSVEQHCRESRSDDLKELINRVLAHYEQYYEEKSRMAQRNIFLVFSPPWFTPFEQSFLWIAGFKPALAFKVLDGSVHDLSEDQRRRLARLKDDTKVNEKMLMGELASLQESVAAPPLLDTARRTGRDGRIIEHLATEKLEAAMETVVGKADMLRTETVVKVVEMLNPVQSVKFLTAVTELHMRIREIGMRRQ